MVVRHVLRLPAYKLIPPLWKVGVQLFIRLQGATLSLCRRCQLRDDFCGIFDDDDHLVGAEVLFIVMRLNREACRGSEDHPAIVRNLLPEQTTHLKVETHTRIHITSCYDTRDLFKVMPHLYASAARKGLESDPAPLQVLLAIQELWTIIGQPEESLFVEQVSA